ncbi:hypothetical protein LNTAR_24853 [Lentisphaera araneosa HTCC2155]|uniref:Uncharacterized protein n=1 Tax=Lentisphaera araneosa HTCC2155 TaxID=313628 RepID=A6DSX8_9BACT|nr:hypothetical protein [Lentisphaera araneosa]EDM25268.1 hypothetical protein LNTAR_24853 [Lentisphaera araneosa HTCC2155]
MKTKHVYFTIFTHTLIIMTIVFSSCKEQQTVKTPEKQKEAVDNLKEVGVSMKMYFNDQTTSDVLLPKEATDISKLDRKNLDMYLNQKVSFSGTIERWKLGNAISNSTSTIWIEGEINFEDIKVTGTLIKKYDLPVFIMEKDMKAVPAGIPVEPGTDLKEASKRYIIIIE